MSTVATLLYKNLILIYIDRQDERWQASQTEVERLRQNNIEALQDAQSCREREAELLAYTQKLTDKVCYTLFSPTK